MAVVLVTLLFAALAPLSPAQATHDPSDPEPSAPECKWYGSVEFTRTLHVEQPDRSTGDLRVQGQGWSGPSSDSTCRGTVHYFYDQYDTSPDGLWWARTADGTVSATYAAGWGSAGGFFAQFGGDETITMELSDSSGGTGTEQIAAGAEAGCFVPGVDTDAERRAIQAIVVTCSQIEGSPEGETWIGTIRMRRTNCDKTVDTDGDKLSDCREYALQTNPSDPDTDDDGLTDGQEVLTYKTDPRNPDTDDGGVPDGTEVAAGTDPLDPSDDGDQPPSITWHVNPRMEDANRDGILDEPYVEGRLSALLEDNQSVELVVDACPADDVTWTLDGQEVGTTCSVTLVVPEGSYQVTASNAVGSTTITATPEHLMIVGLGDSYGSGEGAPHTVVRDGEKFPEWDQEGCHRSRYSAQAQAALRLEKWDAQSAVTFLHLACSGATTWKGVLGAYPDPPGDGAQRAQVEEAAEVALGNPIDAVLLSLGGNDIGFANVITECALYSKCPLKKNAREVGDTSRLETLHKHTQRLLGMLPTNYDTLDACLFSIAADCVADVTLNMDPSRVFITEYPNLARDENGEYCDDVLRPGGIADEELKWAAEVVQQGRAGSTYTFRHPKVTRKLPVDENGLNVAIKKRPEVSGATPVTGIFKASRTHGYCSKKRWVVTAEQSLKTQRDEKGTMHPNRQGQRAYGRIIADAVISALGL